KRQRLVVDAVDYVIQSLYHGLLLFVLPAYLASATLDSVNVVFLVGVVAGALVTAIDPWYSAIVPPRPWLNQLLLGFSILLPLNLAPPLPRLHPLFALR